MATLEEIGLALKEADAAGNEEDARKLAGFYREMQAQEAQNEELPSRTAADTAKDIATTAAKGVIGVDQALVGIADLLPGVNAGKFLEEHGVDFGKMQQQLSSPEYGYFSPQQQEANKSWNEAKTLGEHATSLMEHPSGALSAAGEAIPAIMAGGVGGKAIGKLAGIESALTRGAVGEAGITAGQGAEEIRSQSPDKELDAKGRLAALGQGAVTGAITKVGGKLTEKLGGIDPDTLFTGGLRKAVVSEVGEEAAKNPGIVQRTIASMLGEGLFEEAPQSAQEAMWTNYALDKPLLQGVDTAAIKGGILGGIMGGGASVMHGRGEQPQTEEVQPETTAQETPAPRPEVSEQERRVDIENGLERAGVDPEEHPELYAELSKPEHYQSEESINALDERLQRYKSEPTEKGETEEGINFAKALPAEFDDAAWEEHLNKQREYARQGQPTQAEVREPVQPKEAEVVQPEVTAPESVQAQEETVQPEPIAEEQIVQPEPTETEQPPQPEPTEIEKPSVSTSAITTGHTAQSLQPHLTPEMKKLVENGKLTLHDTADTLPGEDHPENVQGLTTPQGEVHLVADKLTPETLPKVAMHEMGVHVGMRGMVGDKVWNDLTSQALTTKGKAFEAARSAVPENTPDHLKGEETLAYLVENAPHLPIVKRMISAVKNWARTTFGAKLSLTESDVHHLAAKALRRESKTSARTQREGSAFSVEDSPKSGERLAPNSKPSNLNATQYAQVRTPEFKKWFGDWENDPANSSKVVDENGEPLVVYHGTTADFSIFKPTIKGMLGSGIYLTTDVEEASHIYAGNGYREGGNVLPVFADIKNPAITSKGYDVPYDFDNKGFDGVIFNQNKKTYYVASNPNQIKSAIGNTGEFNPENPDIRYSVASNPKLQEQVEKDRQNMRPAPAQKPKKTVKEKLSRTGENLQRAADVIETQFFSHDAAFINSLRRSLEGSGRDAATIGKIMDQNSQSQAVSESSAAAEATLRGGMEYDPTTDFFVAVDKPDNVVNERQLIDDAGTKYGWSEAEVNKFYTTYLVSGRLKEKYEKARALKAAANAEKDPIAKSKLFRESREIMDTLKLEMTEEECNKAREAYKSVDEFVQAEKMWHKIRQNTIDVLVKSGLYSNEKAEAYMDAAFYTPMWRVMTEETKPEELESIFDDMANGKFKTNISSLTKGMREQKFKGSKREVFNMLDNHEHWVQISMSRAIRAKKATDMIDAARRYLPEGSVSRVYGTKSNKDGTVTCYFHGKKQYWKFEDPLMAAAFNGVPAAPFVLRSAAKVSSVLRDGIVLTPTFTLSQLPQDIYDAAFTSGIKNPLKLFTTMVSEFKTTAFSKEDTEAHKALRAIGAVGIKDTIGDTRALHAYDTLHHTNLSKDKTAWRKFRSSLEKFAMAGDNAIRQAVYVRTMEELKDDPRAKSIAYQRAFDIINFRRRGASAKLEQVRSVTPFLGATMQAYRATLQVAAGRGLAYQSSADKLSVRKRLASTSAIMATMAFIYNVLYGGLLGSDEDKDKFNTRDIHYKDTHIMMFGANSMLSVPIRPSIFSLPYITGNHLYQSAIAKSEHPHQVYDAYRNAMVAAFGAPVIPPFFKEPLELLANYDSFTGRPIVPERLRKNEPAYQYDAHTSAFGKLVGQTTSHLPPELQLSPIKVDHFMKGWFSGVGTAILGASNIAESLASSNPTKEHTMREFVRMFPSVPGLVPKEEQPQSTASYYDLREDVERVHNTYNRLVKEGDKEGARKYKENNKALLNESLHQKMNHLKTETDKIHADTRAILGNPRLSSEIKAERVQRLEAKERKLLSHVQNLYNRAYQ